MTKGPTVAPTNVTTLSAQILQQRTEQEQLMLAVYKTERDFWKARFVLVKCSKKPVACSLKVESEDVLTLLVRTVSSNIFSDISVQFGTSAGLQIVEVC